MENQEKLLTTKIGITAAKISFVIGTIIFLTFCCTGYEQLIIAGLYYLVFATIINSLILLTLIISIITNSDRYLELLKTIGIMLLNIPIAWLYFYIVTELPSLNL